MSSNLAKITVALDMLRTARRLLKEAGAERALEKTRAAIKSTEGAERHAYGLQTRSQPVPQHRSYQE